MDFVGVELSEKKPNYTLVSGEDQRICSLSLSHHALNQPVRTGNVREDVALLNRSQIDGPRGWQLGFCPEYIWWQHWSGSESWMGLLVTQSTQLHSPIDPFINLKPKYIKPFINSNANQHKKGLGLLCIYNRNTNSKPWRNGFTWCR